MEDKPITDSAERTKFIQNYTFNMKDKNGLVNSKTLKAEKRLVEMMIAMLAIFCFFFGDMAMVIQFKANFTTANIQNIMMIFIIIMKIFIIILLLILDKITR